jgi:hypothetical protein
MKRLGMLVLLLVSLIPLKGGENTDTMLGVRRFISPDYPDVARLAQFSGDVRLLAKVSEDGRVETVDVLSGAPILAKYAQENLLTWHFTNLPKEEKLDVVYHYRLRGPKIHGPVIPSVSLESPTEVVIISNPPLPDGGSPE